MNLRSAWKKMTDEERDIVKAYLLGIGFGVGVSIIAYGLSIKPDARPVFASETDAGNLIIKMSNGKTSLLIRTP